MSTLLLRSGRIIDGSGAPGFEGHVLAEGGLIKAVLREKETPPQTDAVIDAKGLVVCPGFIDMHSHSDWLLPAENHPEVMRPLVEQGVTTIVGGNCGISPAPVRAETLGLLKAFASIAIDQPFGFNWNSMAEFLDRMDESRPMVNAAQLVGHASIRYAATDNRRGKLETAELQECLDRLRSSFEEGACGLSFGLGYDPGMYSPLEELSAFCSVAAKTQKPVTVHLKALSRISPCYPATTLRAHNLLALSEMLDIARDTGVRLQLSHFIFVGRHSWPLAPQALRMVEDARQSGVDVMIDAFPYCCGNTTIHVPLPYWFLAGLPEAYLNRWARARLRAELELGFRLVGFIYKDFQVMDAAVPGYEDLNGLRMDEVARKWETSSFDAFLRLSRESKGAALMLFHAYSGEPENERALESVLSSELCLFETDVALKSQGYPNPAGYGTFPRILGELARERELFSLESAIERMTGASAERFGLKDRGTISPGKAADLVIFDPQKISDTPPIGAQPAGKPKGIVHVFINGQQAVRNGLYLPGVRAGKMLRT